MKDKKNLIRTIILWSVYALLLAGTIVILCNFAKIFGFNKHLDPSDPSGANELREQELLLKTRDSEYTCNRCNYRCRSDISDCVTLRCENCI